MPPRGWALCAARGQAPTGIRGSSFKASSGIVQLLRLAVMVCSSCRSYVSHSCLLSSCLHSQLNGSSSSDQRSTQHSFLSTAVIRSICLRKNKNRASVLPLGTFPHSNYFQLESHTNLTRFLLAFHRSFSQVSDQSLTYSNFWWQFP